MEQKTERFIKKVENAFASGTVRISQFENLTNEWKQLIYFQCYQDDDAKQVHRRLNHLKLTVQWYQRQFNTQQNKNLSDFFQIMIQFVSVELESLSIYTDDNKMTVDTKETIGDEFSWTGKKRDLIELACSLKEANCINSGNVSLQKLVELFESIFDIELKSFNSELSKMAVRKPLKNNVQRAYFLNELAGKFNDKMLKK
ncbi:MULTISPECIES: RteC domain-containing protein [unclassified Carboxylicivirga]|uniref:RteC domain-containing protein n=1 Tax=Carboxylicivirga TaxID=1628153 RepID=UPI003D344F33